MKCYLHTVRGAFIVGGMSFLSVLAYGQQATTNTTEQPLVPPLMSSGGMSGGGSSTSLGGDTTSSGRSTSSGDNTQWGGMPSGGVIKNTFSDNPDFESTQEGRGLNSGEEFSLPETGSAANTDVQKSSPDDLSKNVIKNPPLPKSDFERFVANTLGRALPVFGSELFLNMPATYIPVKDLPLPESYIIGAGDELVLHGWGTVDVNYRVVVDRTGSINIPKIGMVPVSGVRLADLNNHVRRYIGRVFKNFQLDVNVKRSRSIQVYVVGQAKKPGNYTVSSLSTLINVIFASGGPNENGSMRRIQVRRGGKVITELDLYQFIQAGDRSKDVHLQADDSIIYLPIGPRVAMSGSVRKPAIYELAPHSNTLGDLVALMGGLPATTDTQVLSIESVDPKALISRRVDKTAVTPASLKKPLQDGDIINFFPVSPKFSNAITLRGAVAAPLRYPFKDGMKVSDLIPEIDALVTRDYYRRKNILVQYDKEGQGTTQAGGVETLKNLVDEVNWDYAVIERLKYPELTTHLIPFNLEKAVRNKDPEQNITLQPGDVITIFSKKDVRVPLQKQTRFVRVEGEVSAPGVYQVQANETLRQVLKRVGGITPDAYLFGTEFYRESTRKLQREALHEAVRRAEQQMNSQAANQYANANTINDPAAVIKLKEAQESIQRSNLARLKSLVPTGRIALELSPKVSSIEDIPDLSIEDNDRIVIPSRPNFVYVTGAVNNSNALIWKPSRLVADYLKNAGVDRDAEPSNTFVVRADGTIQTENEGGLFSSGVKSLALMPGDTVVVPEKLDRESAYSVVMRNLVSWSQILGQFGIAAAAIKTLRN